MTDLAAAIKSAEEARSGIAALDPLRSAPEVRAALKAADGALDSLLAAAREAEAALPEGMKHCTIRFEQCAGGHGWLTATNWIVQVCPTCRIAAAEARAEEAEAALAMKRRELGVEVEVHNATKRERDRLLAECEKAEAALAEARDALDEIRRRSTDKLAGGIAAGYFGAHTTPRSDS